MDHNAGGVDDPGQQGRHGAFDAVFDGIDKDRVRQVGLGEILWVLYDRHPKIFDNRADGADQNRFWNIVKESICLCQLQDVIHCGKHSQKCLLFFCEVHFFPKGGLEFVVKDLSIVLRIRFITF